MVPRYTILDRCASVWGMTARLLSFLPFVLPLYVLRFHVFGLPTTVLEVYLLLLFLVFVFSTKPSAWLEGWRRLGSWRGPLIAWLLISFISVFVAPDVWRALGLWRAYVLEPVFVFYVLAALRSELDWNQLRRNFFWLASALGVYALIQYITGLGIPYPWNIGMLEGRRAVGPFPYPNALALLVTPIVAWAFAVWIQRPMKSWLPFVAWMFGLVAILLAKSDGGLVAFFATALVVSLWHGRTRRVALWVSLIGIVALVVMPSIRVPVVRELSFQSWSGQVRLFGWRETWDMLQDRWFFGAGFGGYKAAFAPYHKATAIEIFEYPHTIVFNFWSETGILGVLIFCWIAITWIRLRPRSPFDGLIACVPLLAILVHGLVDVPYFKNDLALAFWLMAATASEGEKKKSP